MHWFLMGAAVPAVTLLAAAGIAAIRTGWFVFMAGLVLPFPAQRPGRRTP
ncbi:hypothetical protein ABZV31_29495 [Streptomyces sp. NPDC005202]